MVFFYKFSCCISILLNFFKLDFSVAYVRIKLYLYIIVSDSSQIMKLFTESNRRKNVKYTAYIVNVCGCYIFINSDHFKTGNRISTM